MTRTPIPTIWRLSSPPAPQHGTLTPITENGKVKKVTYTPAAEYFGYDEFVYTVQDGHGGSATGSVSVLVYTLTVQVYPG